MQTELAGEEGFESCDDGNLVDGKAHRHTVNTCAMTATATTWTTNACALASCGDGLVEAGVEACDDGNDVETDACLNTCQLSRCGDGVIRLDLGPNDPGYEACDDGNAFDDDACLSGCVQARCGDGVLRNDLALNDPAYEACDDGNEEPLDACATSSARLRRLDPETELCDDGNRLPGDGCSPNCGRSVTRVDVGLDHRCALSENGYVYCVGESMFYLAGRQGFPQDSGLVMWSAGENPSNERDFAARRGDGSVYQRGDEALMCGGVVMVMFIQRLIGIRADVFCRAPASVLLCVVALRLW